MIIKEIYCFYVKYPDESFQVSIVDDTSTTVQFYFNNEEKNYPYFESKAYHLSTWCDQHNFKFQMVKLNIEIPIEE